MGAKNKKPQIPQPDKRWKTMYTSELDCILQISGEKHKNDIVSVLKYGQAREQWGAVAELVCMRCFLTAGCSPIEYEYGTKGTKRNRSIDFLFADQKGDEFLVEAKITTGKDTIKTVKKVIEKKTASKLDKKQDMSMPFIIFLWSLNYFGNSNINDINKKKELFYTGNYQIDPVFSNGRNREISGVIFSEINHDINEATNIDKMTLYRNTNPFKAPDLCLRGYPWMTAYNKDRVELENKLQNAVMRISFNEKIEYNEGHRERKKA